jgi:putative inorganic carbon (hco3(-)) transporter
MMTAIRRSRASEIGAAALAGSALGALSLSYQLRPKTSTELAIAAVAVGLACVIFGDPRRFLLAAVVFDIPLEWGKNVSSQKNDVIFGGITGLQISVTTLSLAGLYALWALQPRARGRTPRRALLATVLPLIAYFGVTALSLLVARYRTLGAYEVELIGQTVLMFIYVAGNVRTRNDVDFLATVLIVAILLESGLIAFVKATGYNFSFLGVGSTTSSNYGARVGGTLGSPNDAAAYIALLLPLGLVMLASPTSVRLRRLTLAAVLLGIIALVETGSRGGWVSFAVSVAFLAIWAIRRRIVQARTVVAAAAVLMVLLAPLYGTITARLTTNDNGSAQSRVSLATIAWHMVETHPVLGVGINNEPMLVRSYAGPQFDGSWLSIVHDQYLLIWSESGIFALSAFLWFLAATVRRGLRVANARDPVLSPVALGLTAGVVGRLVHMTVDHFDQRVDLQSLLLAASVLAAIELILRRERRPLDARLASVETP